MGTEQEGRRRKKKEGEGRRRMIIMSYDIYYR